MPAGTARRVLRRNGDCTPFRPADAEYVGKKAAGQFMREQVFNPGLTLPWNELTRHATGEELNPKAFAEDHEEIAELRMPASMTKTKYATAPLPIETMPPGVPYIIGNEAAERFCFYGMRTVLIVFMTKFLLDRQGHLAVMGDEEAKCYYHLFVAGVYFFPILGAILADAMWGKYRTIF